MAPDFIEKDVVVNAGRTTTVELRVRPVGAIAGTVENTSTDSLLKGVKIRLLDSAGTPLHESVTGDDGAYRFAGLGPGAYQVQMVLPRGYLAVGESERLVDLAAGEARCDFQVYRHGAVEGRVLTEDGRPVVGSEVALLDPSGSVVRTARTDENGVYSFLEVPVDKYKVRVAVPETL